MNNKLPTGIYEKVELAIKYYEEAVEDALRNLKINAVIDIIYITFFLVLIIVAAIWTDINGFLTTIGITGLSATSKGKEWIGTIKSYFNDTSKLRLSVKKLKTSLFACDKNDEFCLGGVQCLIEQYFDALEEAT